MEENTMLNEKRAVDKVEVVINKFIQVRECVIIEKNGVEMARNYHRVSFNPLSDISKMPKEAQDIAKVVWTDQVKNAYKKELEEKALLMKSQPSSEPVVQPTPEPAFEPITNFEYDENE
jgi:hypothetical protein